MFASVVESIASFLESESNRFAELSSHRSVCHQQYDPWSWRDCLDYLRTCHRTDARGWMCFLVSLVLWYVLDVGVVEGISKRWFQRYQRSTLQQKFRWRNKTVSTIHALFSCTASIWAFVSLPELQGENFAFGYHFAAEIILMISASYMVYDIVVTLLNSHIAPVVKSIVAHHVAAFIGLYYCGAYRVGMLTTLGFLITEISTPFIQLRWFFDLYELPPRHWMYRGEGAIAVLVFFFARIVFGGFLLYQLIIYLHQYLLDPVYVIFPTFVPVTMLVLNLYWLYPVICVALFRKRSQTPAQVEGSPSLVIEKKPFIIHSSKKNGQLSTESESKTLRNRPRKK